MTQDCDQTVLAGIPQPLPHGHVHHVHVHVHVVIIVEILVVIVLVILVIVIVVVVIVIVDIVHNIAHYCRGDNSTGQKGPHVEPWKRRERLQHLKGCYPSHPCLTCT